MSDGITPLTPQEETKAEASAGKEGYWHRVFVALDIFLNVVFKGREDETISSRAARAATEGKLWGILISKFLDLFEKDHGAYAEAADVERAKSVIDAEDKSGNL